MEHGTEVKNKKFAYKRWLLAGEYHRSKIRVFEIKRAAGHEVRKVNNDERRKLGESLQGEYVTNQKKFWTSIQSTVKGNQDVGRICDNDGLVLCDEEEVRARWKDYFASLLESDQNSNTQVLGQRVEQRRDQDANQMDADCTEKISVEEVQYVNE